MAKNVRGRLAARPSEIPAPGWKDILWRVYAEISDDRVMLVAAGVTYYLLLAMVPALSAFVSVFGLFADPSTIQQQVTNLSAVVPGGGMQIIGEQLERLTQQDSTTLGFTFILSLLVALWSANAGMKSLFEAIGRPPPCGPGQTLVHERSLRQGWRGRRSWSGRRSRPLQDVRCRRAVAQ